MLIALFACLSGICSGARGISGKVPVRLVMSSQVYTLMPLILAQSLGYYDEEGLAVHIENLQSNTNAVRALVGGSADVSTGTLTQVLSLVADGRDVKAFSSLMVQSQIVFVASPGWSRAIRTVQDLRGAPIGVGGFGGPYSITLNWMLAQNGLSVSDVTLVNIGTLATAVAAVRRAKVAAAVLNDVEYLTLRKQGVEPRMLVDTRGLENTKRCFGAEIYPTSVLIASGPWLRRNPATARRFALATTRAMRWMHRQSPASVVDKFPPEYRSDREIDIEVTSTFLPMFSDDGTISRRGAEAVRRVASVSVPALRNGALDLSRTYTNQFVGQE